MQGLLDLVASIVRECADKLDASGQQHAQRLSGNEVKCHVLIPKQTGY
jgi:hypothetical protein